MNKILNDEKTSRSNRDKIYLISVSTIKKICKQLSLS